MVDDDDDDYDDYEDNDKMNDFEGMDFECFKVFNMFVCFFVDENLDCMVFIFKQFKEKIQVIIEFCSWQFFEFQEWVCKCICMYFKFCWCMKKNGMEMIRFMLFYLILVMVENILVVVCESEMRKVVKWMCLEIYQFLQDEFIVLDKQYLWDFIVIIYFIYLLLVFFYFQDFVYVNGGFNYSYCGYGVLSSNLQFFVFF